MTSRSWVVWWDVCIMGEYVDVVKGLLPLVDTRMTWYTVYKRCWAG